MELRRNAIFTTGGGTGIGRALAEALHAKGNNLIISGRRKAADPRAMPLYDFVKETLHALKIAETELLTEKVLAQTCAQLLRSISLQCGILLEIIDEVNADCEVRMNISSFLATP